MSKPLGSKGIVVLPTVFDNISDFDKTLLKQTGRLRSLSKNEVLFKAGERAPFACFVSTGWCVTSMLGRITELLVPGSSLLMSITGDAPAVAEVTALSKATVVCLKLKVLRDVLERNPQLATVFHEVALRRTVRVQFFNALRVVVPLEQRMADVLWHVSLAPDESGSRQVPDCVSQAMLASLLGVPREEINRKRQMLVKSGFLFEENGQWRMDGTTKMMLASMPGSFAIR